MDEIIIYTDDIQILKEGKIYFLKTEFIFIDINKLEKEIEESNCIKECMDNKYKNGNVLSIHKILSTVIENALSSEALCLILYTKEKIPLFKEVIDNKLKDIIIDYHKKKCIVKYKKEVNQVDEEKLREIKNEEYGIVYATRLFFKKK